MNASFKQLAQYQEAMEQHIDARFDEIKTEIATVRATMVTKEDMAASTASLEARMLEAFKQLVAVIDTRLPPQQ
jgi:hypothetical protein